jgi:hypothetical protein
MNLPTDDLVHGYYEYCLLFGLELVR